VAELQNSVAGIPAVALRRVAINYLFTRSDKDGDSDWIRQGNYEQKGRPCVNLSGMCRFSCIY
jgi:hypothetical protein